MTIWPVPRRHWRSYGNDPLPSDQETLNEPLRAFPSQFLRIVCGRCGKERLIAKTHVTQGEILIQDIPGTKETRCTSAGSRVRSRGRLVGGSGSGAGAAPPKSAPREGITGH
jgi:hypothetical protein